ncbi:zinc ribbon domain-containing protein [Candidatus Poriferisodalis sp.]|uniref:zinc ribbon domain-containing protein n=1 Tax=Candidatus Poriferisodalis sp. TaxID=3101277 RepID=UPI003B0179C3
MNPDTQSPDAHAASASAPNDQDEVPTPLANRLECLAQIADVDLQLAQIAHRVAHLPERAIRDDIAAELDACASETEALDAQIAELEREQRRHEGEIELIEAKRAENSARLYSSGLTSPKEAEALTAEAAALSRRQTAVEDHVLELMERLEPLGETRAQLGRRLSAAYGRIDGLDSVISAAEAEAANQRDHALGERAALVPCADPAQLSVYEQRRARARGAPVLGRLVGRTCGACHLGIASIDYERIVGLEAGELAECPQCGALLVR